MSAKKKLVYITSRFPFPLTKGDRLRAYYQLKDLSKTYEIHLISTTDEVINAAYKKELEKFCTSIHIFQLSKFEIGVSLLLNMLTSKPYQVAYFHHFKIQKKINQLLQELKPDHIFAQLIRSTEYVKDYHACSKTLDYMDALSKGMERRYQKAKFPFNLLVKSEWRRLKEYERKIFDYFENHLMISEQDKHYIYHPDYQKIQVIPNGIAAHFFEQQSITEKSDVVFVGNLSYEPNIQAAEYLHSVIHRRLPELSIQVAGANPSRRVERLKSSRFIVRANVADIRDAYSSGKIFVAPMLIGTGLQNKLLEAMAQGLPCVTTTLVNNALKAKVGEEILIANTEEEFILAIQQLLSDEQLYHRIKTNALSFVKNTYGWEAINEDLVNLIQ